MEQRRIKTSAGMETASETAARARAQLERARANGVVSNNQTTNTGGDMPRPNNAVLDALAQRLTEQARGISTSATSGIQSTIASAIKDTQMAGELSRERLISERDREVAFARERAGATYTGAMEGRTGFATQVAALRELTETTEKEVKDLDKRYQEMILAGDAATAAQVAELRLRKLEFQQEQEENFFRNMISVAGLRQQEEQFFIAEMNEQNRFARQMAQSDYQFEKNLGIQYQELDLKAQGLELERERNQISWAEYRLRKSEIEKEKKQTAVAGAVSTEMRKMVRERGIMPNKLDPLAFATEMTATYKDAGIDVDFEEVLGAAQSAKANMVTEGTAPFTLNTGSFDSTNNTAKDEPWFTSGGINLRKLFN